MHRSLQRYIPNAFGDFPDCFVLFSSLTPILFLMSDDPKLILVVDSVSLKAALFIQFQCLGITRPSLIQVIIGLRDITECVSYLRQSRLIVSLLVIILSRLKVPEGLLVFRPVVIKVPEVLL